MNRTHVILNPAAGRGAARRIKDRVARAFHQQGWSVEMHVTDRPGHGVDLAAVAARDGATHIIAVGGDGTAHEVANGVLAAGSAAAFGVVPVGSGNDFAKLSGVYRHDPERAVARLVTAAIRRFDAGHVLREYFINSLGFGFGPAVVHLRNTMPGLRGFLSYLVPILRAFGTFAPPRFDVRAAEWTEAGNLMMLEVCNGTTAGGSYRFAPSADPSDGRLDVCVIRRIGLGRFLLALPRVMRGT
ncbi:MAG TPA: YegS/Rv2252/BmrU family lipid kinase, partial [Gemmatimonadales bacterium]|nr:YegS/Rv2252/BmrU family lipid kinase [Gemmatimonadales bacterium]